MSKYFKNVVIVWKEKSEMELKESFYNFEKFSLSSSLLSLCDDVRILVGVIFLQLC